jgi:hypothetical protein
MLLILEPKCLERPVRSMPWTVPMCKATSKTRLKSTPKKQGAGTWETVCASKISSLPSGEGLSMCPPRISVKEVRLKRCPTNRAYVNLHFYLSRPLWLGSVSLIQRRN